MRSKAMIRVYDDLEQQGPPHDTVLDEMGRLARALPHPPVSLIVFGSFARREAETDSDVDVVVVRPALIDEDHEQWSTSLEAWRSDVRRIAGNPVEALEVGVPDVARKLASRSQVWIDIRREGRAVHGSPSTSSEQSSLLRRGQFLPLSARR